MSETGSMVSSQRTMSSTRSRVGSRFFASSFPLFPFFLALEPGYHYLLSYAGIVVQVMQMLSFVLNPHLNHGETLGEVSHIIYTSHLPFWDDTYTSMTFLYYLPLFCIAAAIVIFSVIVILWLVLSHTPTPRDSIFMSIIRFVLHLSTSVLYIPLMQCFLSQMVCAEGHLWSFPATTCYNPSSSLVTFIVSIICFIILNVMTLLVDTTLFNDDYLSQHPLARKQYINSGLYTLWRAISCIFFHVFLSNTVPGVSGETFTWMPMYIFFSAGLMAISYIFYLPFLRQRTNRIFTAAFLMTSILGFLTFFSSAAAIDSSAAAGDRATGFATMDLDALLTIGLGGVCFLLGWVLADLRINAEMTRSLRQLTDAAADYPSRYTCLFPKGLPGYDVAYRNCVESCNDVADGAFRDNRIPVSLETPFLTRIFSYTDVEVSTRFISTAFRLTGQHPTPEMLRLASQIYMKGMLRYPESVTVVIDFASMINSFTMKPSLALAQCERANAMACTFPTRYRSYRLLANLKLALHLRDTAYQSTCEDAKRAHKEILVNLSQFWNKLLSPQTDRNQILSAYSSIARKRENTDRMFVKALQHQTSDRDLLLKYADFLEQVMLQPDRAEKLRALAAEEIEEEHRHRGQRTAPKTQKGQSKVRQALAIKSTTQDGTHHFWGIRVDSQNILKLVIILILFLTTISQLVVAIISHNRRNSTLRCVQYSSLARTLRAVGELVSVQYWNTNAQFSSSGPRLHYISALASDILSIHNFVSFGVPKSLSGDKERFMNERTVIEATYAAPQQTRYSVTSFLALGYDFAQYLQNIPGAIGRASSNSGGAVPGSGAAQQASLSLTNVQQSLFNDYSHKWQNGAYNASVQTCREWFEEERTIFVGVASGLFGFSVLLIIFYAEVSVMTSPVEKLKNRILSLFAFIPRPKLQEIAHLARQRVETFDQTGDADGDDEADRFAFQEPGDTMGSPSHKNSDSSRLRSSSDITNAETDLGTSPTTSPTSVGQRGDGAHGGKDGAAPQGESDADEETSDTHALLWDTQKGQGGAAGGGFLSRSGIGRKSGTDDAGADDALAENLLGTSSGVSASQRLPLHAVGYKEQFLMIFMIIVLCGTLVSVALTDPLVSANRTTLRNYAQRSSMYKMAGVKVLNAAYAVTSFFATGDITFFNTWETAVEDVETLLPTSLETRPSYPEMVDVRDVAVAVEQFSLTRPTFHAFAAAVSGTTSQYDPTTQTTTTVAAGETARQNMFVSRGLNNEQPVVFEQLMTGTMTSLAEVSTTVYDEGLTHANDMTAKRAIIAVIVLSLVGIVLLAAVAMVIHWRMDPYFLRRSHFGWILLIGAALALLATLILCILVMTKLDTIRSMRNENAALASAHGKAVYSYMWPLVMASKVVQQGLQMSVLDVLNYFDSIQDTTWQTFAQENLGEEQATQMISAGTLLRQFQMIALKLQDSANNLDITELNGVTWDFSAESDAMNTRLNYPDANKLRYTTTAADLAKTPAVKMMMAFDVISNARAQDTVSTMNTMCAEYFEGELEISMGNLLLETTAIKTYIDAAIGTAAAAVFLAAIFSLVFLSRRAKHRYDELGLVEDSTKDSMESVRLWASLIGILILLAAVYLLSMIELMSLSEQDQQIDLMNARSYHVISGLVSAELWSANVLDATVLAYRNRRDWVRLENLNTLISSAGTRVYGASKALDTLLRGNNVMLSERYRFGFDPVSGSSLPGPDRYTFPNGLDSAVASWMYRTLEFVNAVEQAAVAQSTVLMQLLRNDVMPLLRGLDEASDLLTDALVHRSKMLFVAIVALAVVLAVAVVLVLVFVFLPSARRQVAEETGYRMLMRLIPQDIRESIPAIREFVNSGSGGNSGAASSSAGSLSDDFSMGRFDDLAPPIIAINAKGIVIKFNRQAEEIFGYSTAEVLGNNISMLMPTRIGVRHDSFLANYDRLRKPGYRAVFQQQEMHARRKDLSLFNIRMTAYEMKRGSNERAFVAFIEDIDELVRARHEESLNRYIQDEVIVPMIAIDSLGTVLRFNAAAEACFGRSAKEVLNQNVKMLMPESVAVRHDSYLATYLRTKEKHAIDSTARARGVRKSGEEFPLELKIKEIVHDNVSTYVGFCRDLSRDSHLEEAAQINQVIYETCVIPVICTDLQGRVILYSRSAERVFGYTPEEVVSNNCKMLMPNTVADHHDAHLERYRESWGRRNAPIMPRVVMGRHKDGHLIPLLSSLHEVKSTSTSNTALVGFFRELAEERSLERGLSIDEIIAENHQQSLVVINSDGIIERVNKATLLEFGYNHAGELVNRNVKILMPDSVAMRHDEYINRYLVTGISTVLTPAQGHDVLTPGRRLVAKRRDGTQFPMELRLREIRSVRDPNASIGGGGGDAFNDEACGGDGEFSGQEVRFIGYIKNISRDVRLERQLAINKTVVEHTPLPLCLLDGRGFIVLANAAASRTLRTRADEFTDRPFVSLLQANAAAAAAGLDYNVEDVARLFAPLVGRTTEQVIIAPSGLHVPVAVTVEAIDRRRMGDAGAAGGGGGLSSGNESQSNSTINSVAAIHSNERAYLVYLRDISEDGVTGQRAARSTRIAELSPIPLVHFSEFGNIIGMNLAAERQLGYDREEVVGKHVSVVIPDPLAFADMLLTNTSSEENQNDSATASGAQRLTSPLQPPPPPQPQRRNSGGDGSFLSLEQGDPLAGRDVPRQRHIRTDMVTKAGERIPVEVSVAEVIARENVEKTHSYYVAYMYDQSGAIQLDAATEACQAQAELSPHPIVAADGVGTIVMCNQAACVSFGYSSIGDLVGRDVSVLMPDAVAQGHAGYMRSYHKTQQARRVGRTSQVQCRRADGALFPCSMTLRRVPAGRDDASEEDKDVLFIARFVDRSENGAIAAAHTFMETLLRLSSHVALLFFSGGGELRKVSARTVDVFGYASAEEMQGQLIADLLPTMPSLNEMQEQATGTEAASMSNPAVTRRRVVTGRRKDGRTFTAELLFRHLRVGEVVGFVGCLLDPSAQDEMHARRKVNLALVEHSPVPVIVMDSHGVIESFSPAAEEFFSYTADDVATDEAIDVLTLLPEMPEDRAAVGALRAAAAASVGGSAVAPVTSMVSSREGSASDVDSADGGDEIDPGLLRLTTAGARTREEGGEPSALRGRHARLRYGGLVLVDVTVVELPPEDGASESRYALFVADRSCDTAVQAAQQLSGMVARSLPLPALVVSETGIILEANTHAGELTQHTTRELEGEQVSVIVSFRDLLTSSDRELDVPYVRRDMQILVKDGTMRIADAYVCPLPTRMSLGAAAQGGNSSISHSRQNRSTVAAPAQGGGSGSGGGAAPAGAGAVATSTSRSYFVTLVDHGPSTAYRRARQRFQTIFQAATTPTLRLDTSAHRVLDINLAAAEMLGLAHNGAACTETELPQLSDILADQKVIKKVKRFVAKEGASNAASSVTLSSTRRRGDKSATTTGGGQRASLSIPTSVRVRVGDAAGGGGGSSTGASRTTRQQQQHHPSSVGSAGIRTRDVELHLQVSDAEDLATGGCIVYLTDVEAERRQHLHASLLASMQSAMHEPHLIVSDNDMIVSMNAAATDMLGYKLPPDGTMRSAEVVEGGFVALYAEADEGDDGGSDAPGRREVTADGERAVVVSTIEVASNCPLATSADGATAARASVSAADAAAPAPAATATTEVKVLSRRRVMTKVPCRTIDGRIAPLDLRLCEVEVPLVARTQGTPTSTARGSVAEASSTGGGRSASDRDRDRAAAAEDTAAMARYYVIFLHDSSAKHNMSTNILLGEAIIEKNPSAIVVSDIGGTIVKFNAAAERLFRFEREQLLGKNVALLMPEIHGTNHDNYLSNYMRTREQHVIGAPRRVVAECKDGEQMAMTLNMLEALDDHGVPYLFIGFFQKADT